MTSALRGLNIGIAGAGIAGLAAAAFLADQGHRVRVFDQFDAPQHKGSGMMVQPVGLAVLRALGLDGAVTECASPVTQVLGRNRLQRIVLEMRYGDLRPDAVGYGTQRALLFNLLLHRAESAGAELVPSTVVLGHRIEDGRAVLETDQGDIGPFDLVLDSLGFASPLCPQGSAPLTYGALWALLDWPEGGPFAADRLEQRYRFASRMVGVLPVGRLTQEAPDKLTFFWSLRGIDYAAWRAQPLDLWKQQVADLWPETATLLSQINSHDDLVFAQYTHRTLSRPGAGVLAHLGDSFHATSPQLGQGANMALLDAWALATAVAGAASVPEATAHYARLRRRHVWLYQTASWLFTPVYQSDSRILPWVRDKVVAPISRIPPLPRVLARLVTGEMTDPVGKIERG